MVIPPTYQEYPAISSKDIEASYGNLSQWDFKKQALFNSKEDASASIKAHMDILLSRGNVQKEIDRHKEFVRAFPIVYFIESFVRNRARDAHLGAQYIEGILKLRELHLLPIEREGRYRLAGELKPEEHLFVIDQIRCKPLKFAEREGLIRMYIQMTKELSGITFGVFPEAWDQERDYASKRLVDYDKFSLFIEELSLRETVIAKLLYFSSVSIEELLDLEVSCIDFSMNLFCISSGVTRLPLHVLQSISAYLGSRKKGRLLVNLRGERMERNYIVSAFGRVSSKLGNIKITPTDLSKAKA